MTMVGSALGSGPFGEFFAIEWLQMVAGLPIFLSVILYLFAMFKWLTGEIDAHGIGSVGVVMMAASGFAAVVYLIGFACIYTDLMWEGAFPHRLPENLLGSALFFLLGLFIYTAPRLLDRIDEWREHRHPRA
jgi:hypothetical protein